MKLEVEHHPQLLLTDHATAAMYGISRSTLWRRVADGTLPKPIRIGGATRFVRAEHLAVIDQARAARGAA
jgi:predicted DNA-binding transcriptional regulator AlpA